MSLLPDASRKMSWQYPCPFVAFALTHAASVAVEPL